MSAPDTPPLPSRARLLAGTVLSGARRTIRSTWSWAAPYLIVLFASTLFWFDRGDVPYFIHVGLGIISAILVYWAFDLVAMRAKAQATSEAFASLAAALTSGRSTKIEMTYRLEPAHRELLKRLRAEQEKAADFNIGNGKGPHSEH